MDVSGPQIQLASGKYFHFDHPEDSEFTIEDIAHALSMLCRYTGHCKDFYSVAQHCVLASTIVAPPFAMSALMHDASEAFLNDLARPVKHMLADYQALEARVELVIAERFGLPHPMPQQVKHADLVMLATEKRDLMPDGPHWELLNNITPMRRPIVPWYPKIAKAEFLIRYGELLHGTAA